MSYADQNCDLLIAGSYTSTQYVLEVHNGILGLVPVTSPPYAFSAKLVEYLYL